MLLELVHLVAEADQLAAKLRDARCCDALNPCPDCVRLRATVLALRRAVRAPQQS
jgi:hypothetical protein